MPDQNDNKDIPAGQKFYDNLILLFIIGFIILIVSYTGWGLYEILVQPSLPK